MCSWYPQVIRLRVWVAIYNRRIDLVRAKYGLVRCKVATIYGGHGRLKMNVVIAVEWSRMHAVGDESCGRVGYWLRRTECE